MFDAISKVISDELNQLIPEDTVVEPYRDKSLNEWRTNGSYSCSISNKKMIELKVNQREYAAVVFSECNHFLNHACEHRALLLNTLSGEEDPSPSWGIVSLYYMALFLALALTRACNKSFVFLDKAGVAQLAQDTGRDNDTPGAGSFIFRHALEPDTFIPKVTVSRTGASRFHEAAWDTVSKFMNSAAQTIQSQSATRRPTASEIISLRAAKLFEKPFPADGAWQSIFRNAVNYRPGFSYRTVVSHNFLPKHLGLKRRILNNFEDVLSLGEAARHHLSRGIKHPCDSPAHSTDLLIAQALIIESVVNASLAEIVSLRSLRCSAFKQRKAFNSKFCRAPSLISIQV